MATARTGARVRLTMATTTWTPSASDYTAATNGGRELLVPAMSPHAGVRS